MNINRNASRGRGRGIRHSPQPELVPIPGVSRISQLDVTLQELSLAGKDDEPDYGDPGRMGDLDNHENENGNGMGSRRRSPRNNDSRGDGYSHAITAIMNIYCEKLQMLFIILPSERLDIYSAVKKRCIVQYGIPSQCFLAKHLNSKRLMVICSNVAIQMNAKLGGEPWNIRNPLDILMVAGFDVYHGGPRTGGGQGQSVGAMVSTTSGSLGRCYSTTSFHENREEISPKICSDFRKCLEAWEKVNDELPKRIFFYRDGVGKGQLNQIYTVELEAMKTCIREVYPARQEAKLTFIVLSKRTNTRFFLKKGQSIVNPSPGTVVDDVVTRPERWDFYLTAQTTENGTSAHGGLPHFIQRSVR